MRICWVKLRVFGVVDLVLAMLFYSNPRHAAKATGG
jgi:hypothetical protein